MRTGIVLVLLMVHMPFDLEAQELWQYQCACRISWESSERLKPDSVFATGDRKFVAVCGNKEIIDGRVVFSNISLTLCWAGHAFDGHLLFTSGPAEEFTVEVSGDTLIMEQILPWPMGTDGTIEKTVVYETRYSFIENMETGDLMTLVQTGTSESLIIPSIARAESIAVRTQALLTEEKELTEDDLVQLASCAASKNAKCIEIFRSLENSTLLTEYLREFWEIYELAVRNR